MNSANGPVAFEVGDAPESSQAENVFSGEAIRTEHESSLRLDLPAYGVAGVRLLLAKVKTK